MLLDDNLSPPSGFAPVSTPRRELGAPTWSGDVAQGPLSGPAAFPSVTALATPGRCGGPALRACGSSAVAVRGKSRRAGERALRYVDLFPTGRGP